MKFFLNLVSLCLICTGLSHGQNLSHSIKLKIYCKDFLKAKDQLLALSDSIEGRIFKANEKNIEDQHGRSMEITIWCKPEAARRFESRLDALGFVTDKEINTTTEAEAMEQLELELKYLGERKQRYEQEIANRSSMSEEKYTAYWDELRKMDENIFNLQKSLAAKQRQATVSVFDISLIEELYTPTAQTWQNVQLVNMPGIESDYLRIENPKAGISGKTYAGGQIKYLFTRGKSYVRFGVLRDLSSKTDTGRTQIKEIFLYSFGQDFYPRHFGRGSRTYLNLYTGYTVGGFFATADNFSRNIFLAAPHIGVELFKNQYVLFDTQAAYFIPFYANRNLRGLTGNVSFNFVF